MHVFIVREVKQAFGQPIDILNYVIMSLPDS